MSLGSFKFKFHEYSPLNKEEQDKGELNTTMCLYLPTDPAIYSVTKKIGKAIRGIVSIEYVHKHRLIIQRGNDMFPWENLVEPLILFLYQNNPTVEAVEEIESAPAEFIDY
jgi:hypothetical protein